VRNGLLSWIYGYVCVHCETTQAAQFLESFRRSKINIWDIQMLEGNHMKLSMPIRDCLTIRSYIRMTSGKVKIHKINRFGFFILLVKVKRKAWFLSGVILFLCALMLSLSLIWRVEVVGNQHIPSDEILELAKKHGISPLRWQKTLKNPSRIAKKMQTHFRNVSWLGIERKGVVVRIRIVEAKATEIHKKKKGHHLIANKSATISHIHAEKGKPIVTINQRVHKGDILISGWLGNEEYAKLIQTEGMVKGYVWYDIHIKVPLQRRIQLVEPRSWSN
jgi:similar to stage IV sporulation protein